MRGRGNLNKIFIYATQQSKSKVYKQNLIKFIMDSFIKKIFEGKKDEWTHSQFQKFSRGEFQKRAMFKIKNQSGKYTLATTSEYAKELVRAMGEKLETGKTQVTGAIISALDQDSFKYEEKKMAMGVRKYIINREMTGGEIVQLCDNVRKAFFGLSFSVNGEELKIKDKSPKSMKGASSAKNDEDELKIDFCKLTTNDKKIIDSILFDDEARDFKKVEVYHDFIITEIVIPPELKNERDFAKVREGALRKGKIIRNLDIDGKKIRKDIGFEA